MLYRKVESCDQLFGEAALIQSQLIDYIIHLREEKKLVSKTIHSNLEALKKFYDTNDVELKWKKIKMYVGKVKKKGKKDRPYTHQEIAKMLEKSDQRTRIAILLMCSAGLRVGALPSLKIRNLEKIYKYNHYKITVYENEDEEYTTFCSPECRAAIDSYLEYRERHGERPLSEDSPLIREEFDVNDPLKASRPRAVTDELFKYMIWRAGHDSGVIEKHPTLPNEKRIRNPIMGTHGFRKFFQTTCIINGMSPLYSEFLMGHRSGGLALESYTKPTESDLLEGNDKMIGYVGVMDFLTINEENRLRREVTSLTEKQDEIKRMKDKHEQEMKSIREEMNLQFSQVMELIRENPKLAKVKPEVLVKKKR
jgi:integrase